jgi:hypothetical protein
MNQNTARTYYPNVSTNYNGISVKNVSERYPQNIPKKTYYPSVKKQKNIKQLNLFQIGIKNPQQLAFYP